MSLTSLFEKIAGKQKQRAKARVNDFRALVRSIGTGQEPDADQVERVLSDAGRSLDDLRDAVERYQPRCWSCSPAWKSRCRPPATRCWSRSPWQSRCPGTPL
jgi:hypothetical protein